MKKSILILILSLLYLQYSYSQEQAPAIEWSEPYSAGSTGSGSLTAIQGPNILFSLLKSRYSNSSSASISKFYADGVFKSQVIQSEGGSGAINIKAYASQDAGILVHVPSTSSIRKYDTELNFRWESYINYTPQKATATLANGFYILSTTVINGKTTAEIRRLKNDGSLEWSVDITSIWSSTSDIQATSDDGVIIATSKAIKKFSVVGKELWSNTIILDGYQLTPVDATIMYVQTYNLSTNTRKIVQLNTIYGSANWIQTFFSEAFSDFKRTSDNGCILSTTTALYKYNSGGILEWKNQNYSQAKITTTGDDKIFLTKNDNIIKLTFNNVEVWSKNFNGDHFNIQDIVGTSDFGLYVVAKKRGVFYSTAPDFFLFKLAPPSNPCKTKMDIIGESVTACKNGTLSLSSKIGNSLMTDLMYLGSFSYKWNKNNTPIRDAPNLAYTANESGLYNLTLTQQGGCQATSRDVALVIINETPPTIVADNNQVCAGNAVHLTAGGCDGTVVWSTGERGAQIKVTPQTTTSYNALCEREFNNELCQSFTSSPFTVKVLSASNLRINTIAGNKEFCEFTSTELKPNVNGGTPPLLYVWTKDSNGFSQSSNLIITEAGKYVLSVFDNIGCVVRSDTMLVKKVINPAQPVLTAQGNTELCVNTSVALSTSSKENTYQWYIDNTELNGATNPSYTASIPGRYTLKVSNESGCSAISENAITITQIIIEKPTIRQSDDSLISSASAGNKWYLNGSELPFSTQQIKFTEVGSYQVKVFEQNCESAPSDIFQPILLANEQEYDYIKLYPNPSSDKVFIKSPNRFNYKLIDVSGKLLSQSSAKENMHIVDINNFPSGNYLIILQEENGKTITKKIATNR